MRLTSLLALAATLSPALSHPFSSSDTTPNHLTSRQSTISLPTSYQWTSTGPILGPKSDSRNLAAIKDPSIIYHNGAYHVFASTASSAGYNLVYVTFTDFASASNAPFHYLDASGIGTGYRAAPQVFFFEPQQLWYLVYQNGNAAYSTNPDITNPSGWTSPQNFYSGTPATVTQNIGDGYWVDMWVICDDSLCHLFSSDDNGHLYRSQTSLSSFPAGMGEPVIDLQDADRNRLFEAANVYSVPNASSSQRYLLLVEAIGSTGRYFRSWTSASIAGPWDPLADTQENPWARANNVVFSDSNTWTSSISHGELIRTSVDEKLEVDICDFRYLYQGLDPGASGDYNALPWKLGLLTLENVPSGCGGDGGGGNTPDATTTVTQPEPTGCVTARWGQCGGNGFSGCTSCESPYSCVVSNEWYSQCL